MPQKINPVDIFRFSICLPISHSFHFDFDFCFRIQDLHSDWESEVETMNSTALSAIPRCISSTAQFNANQREFPLLSFDDTPISLPTILLRFLVSGFISCFELSLE